MIEYVCPKCGSNLTAVSTASIPPIITYHCFWCGWTSEPVTPEIIRIPYPEQAEEGKQK